MRTTIAVVAKAPVPGKVKTRLCPPLTPAQAATIAEAALADTLDAVAACDADRRVLVLDGEPGPWLPPGFDVVPQAGGSLAQRLEAAWGALGGGAIQIGMDTPQVTPSLLREALAAVTTDGAEQAGAVLGGAADGGWWLIGFREPPPGRTFIGIPTSSPCTGALQRHRLDRLGLRVAPLSVLRDLDTFEDALAIARLAPGTRTARAVHQEQAVGTG